MIEVVLIGNSTIWIISAFKIVSFASNETEINFVDQEQAVFLTDQDSLRSTFKEGRAIWRNREGLKIKKTNQGTLSDRLSSLGS